MAGEVREVLALLLVQPALLMEMEEEVVEHLLGKQVALAHFLEEVVEVEVPHQTAPLQVLEAPAAPVLFVFGAGDNAVRNSQC